MLTISYDLVKCGYPIRLYYFEFLASDLINFKFLIKECLLTRFNKPV